MLDPTSHEKYMIIFCPDQAKWLDTLPQKSFMLIGKLVLNKYSLVFTMSPSLFNELEFDY